MLLNNAFPSGVVAKLVDQFIADHSISPANFSNPPTNQGSPSPNDKNFFTVPYLGRPSLKFQQNIRRNFQTYDLEITPSYSTTKVSEYFSLKSKSPRLFKTNIVYQFTCLGDPDISYIGESKRQLFERIAEHRNGKDSAVFDHIYSCTSCQNTNNIADQFEVLKQCTTRTILSTEVIMISKFRPVLNKQLGPSNGMLTSLALYKWCVLKFVHRFKIAHFIYLHDLFPSLLIVRIFLFALHCKKVYFCILRCFYANFNTTILSLIINFEQLALLIYFPGFLIKFELIK